MYRTCCIQARFREIDRISDFVIFCFGNRENAEKA